MKHYQSSFTAIIIFLLLNNIGIAQPANWNNSFQKPKAFIENKGQFDGRNWRNDLKINYAVEHNGFSMFFNQQGFTYRLDKFIKNKKENESELEAEKEREKSGKPKWTNISELINVSWIGADKNVKVIAQNITDYYFTYTYRKPGSKKYYNEDHANGYTKLLYKNLYHNIDVDYEIHQEKGIKYNLTLHPGADLSTVQLKYENYHTNAKSEFIKYFLEPSGNFKIQTSLDEITELKPYAYYKDSGKEVKVKFRFENDILSFIVEKYDNTREVIIDPWVINSTFNSSTAVWEVETDGAGNVYVIGGETPMTLDKYNSAGVFQWTHPTPWDTASVWLGTLATDNSGTSYITSGTAPEMQRVSNTGATNWTQTGPSGLGGDAEWWSITFNCDKTKLVVGGTTLEIFPSFNAYATIFNMDITNGNVLSSQNLAYTNLGGFGATPIEVRSISSSKNAKYIFLTHEDVGAINQNIGACPNNLPVFQVDNNHHLGYKCENYLPATQNGGGLKALVANDLYIYTHSGDKIRKRALSNGALIATATIPGGSNQTFMGDIVVHNSGLATDNCGNIYAGSINNVIKFDADLNILAQTAVAFTVYDVSVNSNGEVIAVGAQSDNSANSRNGRIQALNLTACAQFVLICCDANVCPADTVCTTDVAFTLTSSTSGGTWSGTGITNASTGLFNPSVAGAGSHTIYYTLACGTDSTVIVVNACATLTVCQETNGNITVSNGTGPYTWEQYNPAGTTPITNSAECTACGGSWFFGTCLINSIPATDCNSPAYWSTFATGTTVTPSGVWPIRVTDASSNTTTINSLASLPNCSGCPALTITISANVGTCSGQSNGSFSASTSGGTGPYDYTLVNGGGTTVASYNNIAGVQSFTGLAAGTYTINVVDNNACPGSTTVTISTIPITAPAITGTTTICSGNSTTLNAGVGYITYSWSTGATSQTISVNTAGTYSVTVTNAGGCSANTSANVTVATAPSVTVAVTDATCGASNGSVTANASSGTSPYTYSWSGGQTTATVNNLSVGTYNVTVTDNAGCTATGSGSISNTGGPSVTVAVTNSTCSASNGSVTATASGGTSPYTYLWSGGQTTAVVNNLPVGTYDVTVTDNAGCTATGNGIINSIGGPSVTVTVTDVLCGASNGSATVTANGGAPPYTYLWSGGQTTTTINNLPVGTYSVTVTDNASCNATGVGSISSIGGPTIALSETDVICTGNNGTASVVATGGNPPYQYIWNTGAITTSITGLTIGTYAVSVTDINNCLVIDSITVSSSVSMTTSIAGTNIVCSSSNIGAADFTVTGGTSPFTYLWSNGAITQDITGLSAGTYTVTVTDNTIGPASGNIVVNPDFNGGNTGFSSAYNYSSDLLPAGNYMVGTNSWNYNPGFCTYNDHTTGSGNFLIVNGAGNPNTSVWCQTIAISPNTIYNFSSWVATLNPASPALLQFEINGTTIGSIFNAPPACAVWQQFQATWNSGTNTSATICIINQNTTSGGNDFGIDDISFNSVGTGCTSTESVTITQTVAVTSAITATPVTCNGTTTGAIDLNVITGTAPLTFLWSNGTTTEDLTNIAAGNYSVTVTDVNLCTTTASTTITQPALLAVTLTGTNILCNGTNTGAVTSATTGGTSPYNYSWSNGASSQNLSNIGSGTYTVTINDANNCVVTSNVSITQPAAMTVIISNQTNVSCNGGNDGSATVTANGGSLPYSYLWTNGQTSATATNLVAGNYTVTITDAQSCTSTLSLIITQQTSLSASITGTDPLCFGASSGSANLVITGGYLPYTYLWSNGSTTEDVSNLAAGIYNVTTTDAQSCSVTASVTLTSPVAISVTTSSTTNISCFGGNDGTASVNATGGTQPYTYTWAANPLINSNSVSNLSAGNNPVTVTDANNCSFIHNVALIEPLELILSTSSDISVCSGASTTLTAIATGGTLPYSYIWNNIPGGSSVNVNPSSTTSYEVYVVDANGCTSSLSKINVNVLPPVAVQADCFMDNICLGDSAQVFVTASLGNGGPYIITNSNGLVVTSPFFVYPQQTQQVVVTATDGCNSTASDSVLINVYPAPTIEITADVLSGCTPLLVQFHETSLNAGQSYIWDFGSPDENNLSLSKNPVHLFDVPGSYNISLTVTSAQGCISNLVMNDLIQVYPVPDARFTYTPSNASIIYPTVNFTNYSTGNIGNYWFFGDGDSSIEVHPEHIYGQVGSYEVTLVAVTDKNCMDTVIEIVKINDILTFYAPSAFSPDKDGKNDIFYVFASGIQPNSFRLMIYDRWGELIFKSEDILKGWDGKVEGKISQMGTYAWIAIFKDYMGNQKTQAGKVTLIR